MVVRMGIKKINYNLLIFIISIILLNSYIIFNINKSNDIKENTFRFHVIANSNSLQDQIIKLKISSKIEDFINKLDLKNKSKSQIYNTILDNSSNIINIANNTLKDENVEYDLRLNIGKIYYSDSKDNELIRMSSGTYNSFEILLGKAEGKNFWGLINSDAESIQRLKDLDTLLPGIAKLCDNINFKSNKNIEYKSLLKNFFKNVKTTT